MIRGTLRSAIAPLARALTSNAARIITYHRFGPSGALRRMPVDVFDAQLRFLARNYNVASLAEVVGRLRTGKPLDPGTVVLTVDDGYRDFAEFAYPLLRRYGMPATLYVIVGAIDGRQWLWFDRLHYSMHKAKAGRYTVQLGENSVSLDLDSLAERNAAWELVGEYCIEAGDTARRALLANLEGLFGADVPPRPTAEYASLGWNELAAFDPSLIEIGSHSLTHAILSQVNGAEQKREIVESKQTLESKLGTRVDAFSYPNGYPSDIDDHSVALVSEAGYSSAVMNCGTFVDHTSELFRLSRMGAEETVEGLARQLDGTRHLAARFHQRFLRPMHVSRALMVYLAYGAAVS